MLVVQLITNMLLVLQFILNLDCHNFKELYLVLKKVRMVYFYLFNFPIVRLQLAPLKPFPLLK